MTLRGFLAQEVLQIVKTLGSIQCVLIDNYIPSELRLINAVQTDGFLCKSQITATLAVALGGSQSLLQMLLLPVREVGVM